MELSTLARLFRMYLNMDRYSSVITIEWRVIVLGKKSFIIHRRVVRLTCQVYPRTSGGIGLFKKNSWQYIPQNLQ